MLLWTWNFDTSYFFEDFPIYTFCLVSRTKLECFTVQQFSRRKWGDCEVGNKRLLSSCSVVVIQRFFGCSYKTSAHEHHISTHYSVEQSRKLHLWFSLNIRNITYTKWDETTYIIYRWLITCTSDFNSTKFIRTRLRLVTTLISSV